MVKILLICLILNLSLIAITSGYPYRSYRPYDYDDSEDDYDDDDDDEDEDDFYGPRNYAIEYEKKNFGEFGKGGSHEHYRNDNSGGGGGGGGGRRGGVPGKRPGKRPPPANMDSEDASGGASNFNSPGAPMARAIEYEKSNYAEGGRGGNSVHYKDDGAGGGPANYNSRPGRRARARHERPYKRNLGLQSQSPRGRAIEYEKSNYAEGGRGGNSVHYKDDSGGDY